MRRTLFVPLVVVVGLLAVGCVIPPPPDPGTGLCPPGTFSTTGEAPCTPAPVGTFVDVEGATEATPCPVGKFQDEEGQIECKDAQPGSFVDLTGAASATLCPLGRFQPNSGATECLLAPIGTYVDFEGAAAATDCPPGTTTDFAGATSVDDCLELVWSGSILWEVDDFIISPAGEFISTDYEHSVVVNPDGSGSYSLEHVWGDNFITGSNDFDQPCFTTTTRRWSAAGSFSDGGSFFAATENYLTLVAEYPGTHTRDLDLVVEHGPLGCPSSTTTVIPIWTEFTGTWVAHQFGQLISPFAYDLPQAQFEAGAGSGTLAVPTSFPAGSDAQVTYNVQKVTP